MAGLSQGGDLRIRAVVAVEARSGWCRSPKGKQVVELSQRPRRLRASANPRKGAAHMGN